MPTVIACFCELHCKHFSWLLINCNHLKQTVCFGCYGVTGNAIFSWNLKEALLLLLLLPLPLPPWLWLPPQLQLPPWLLLLPPPPFYGPPWILSGTTQVSQYQKGKTSRDSVEQEIVSGSGISWAICKYAPWPRKITLPASHHSVFTGRMPFLPPNQQCQNTEGNLKVGDDNKTCLTIAVLLTLIVYNLTMTLTRPSHYRTETGRPRE